MRKLFILSIICILLLFLLTACGKSENVQAVDDKIQAIGTVTLDSENAIIDAEEGYTALTDKEKKQVEYYQTLKEARNKYDSLASEKEEQEEKEAEEKKEIKDDIEDLIDDNSIKKAREEIDKIDDKYSDLKKELEEEIADKCYAGFNLVKFGEIATVQPEKSKEEQDEGDYVANYYYFKNMSDMKTSFDDYNAYLNKETTKIGSDSFFMTTYKYELDGKEISYFMFDSSVDGYYLMQVNCYKNAD